MSLGIPPLAGARRDQTHPVGERGVPVTRTSPGRTLLGVEVIRPEPKAAGTGAQPQRSVPQDQGWRQAAWQGTPAPGAANRLALGDAPPRDHLLHGSLGGPERTAPGGNELLRGLRVWIQLVARTKAPRGGYL